MVINLRSSDCWLPVSIAPFGGDLEVCVFDKRDIHALVFPCHRAAMGWIDSTTQQRLDIEPTHWRNWSESRPLKGFLFGSGRGRL
jgi:hypothetical protein